jgi:glutamate-ammonia-ligase adenylyltransferase
VSVDLEAAIGGAPDPALARVAVGRAHDAGAEVTDPALVRLLGFSIAATDLLVRHPEEAPALADPSPRDAVALGAELAGDVRTLGAAAGLRRFRRRAMLRLAARDLGGATVDEVVAEISDVADVLWAAALGEAGAGDLAVIALGKWGGRELNYASDVDLLFVHADPGPDAQALAESAATEVVRLLADPTEDGIALRVDTALRPGGRGGALSRSCEATLAYYERQAATWERQAMLKARAAAGDAELGESFVAGLAPFVYPDHLEPAAIDDVRRTKVRLEEYIRQRGKEFTEVKRGRGGIRDVEFAIQLLQIVHGRSNPRLRSPGTLAALAALADEGYVAREDAEALADAYRFLRRVEHRLQIVRDLQTHDLPDDARARTTLARSLGLTDAGALQRRYDETTGLVRQIHERLFYRPLLEAFAGPATPALGRDRAATEELLEGLGFARPERGYDLLAALIDPSRRIGKVLGTMFPVAAPALALAPDPDAALVRLGRIADAVGADPGPADALAGDATAVRRLVHLAGASGAATDALVRQPGRITVLTGGGATTDHEAAWSRAAADHAARLATARDTGLALAAIADAVVADAVSAVSPGLPFAVIGLGKLGAREQSFASDLDVVFVYEGEGPEDQRRANEAAEGVMRHVRAAAWEIDADLRPEGRNGPLARSLAGFLEYWQRYAEPWEFQVLLRTRPVAGDDTLGRRFASAAEDMAYPPDGISLDRIIEIRRMRDRIERERVRPPEAARFHVKLGHGSLADVQFSVEMLLQRHGGPDSAVRTTSTFDAIERLAEARLIERSVARDLGEAFMFLADVKNALEVDRRIHAEAIPAATAEQDALARRLGYQEYPRQTFIDDYLRITRRARRAMERVFHEEGA